MKNKKLLLIVSLVLAMTMSLGGTLAYLTDTDSDVNTMTLGSVKIVQHEYQRATNAEGTYETKSIDEVTSYVLEAFEQNKPLLPIVGDPSLPGDNSAYAGWDDTTVRMTQVDSYGGMQVFAGKNAVDKFVVVENKGNSDAYVRTYVAIEVGSTDGALIQRSFHFTWTENDIGTVNVNGNNYNVFEYVYNGWSEGGRHVGGKLPAGDTAYPNLSQVYIKSAADNADLQAIDGNKNGKLDIIVLSQAVQADGFADATTALEAGFTSTKKNEAGESVKDTEIIAGWLAGVSTELPTVALVDSAEELKNVLETVEEGTKVVLAAGNYGTVDVTTSNITIVGNEGTVIENLDLNAQKGITLQGITFDAAKATTVYGKSGAKEYVANITGSTTGDAANRGASDIQIINCTFTGTPVDGAKYVPICFEEQGRPTSRATNITIEGCVFECNAFNYIRLNYLSAGTVKITNNVFGGGKYGTLHNTINATGNSADFVVEGNKFYNWGEKVAFGSSRQGSHQITLTFNNNTFSNSTENEGIVVLKSPSYTTGNHTVIVSGNTPADIVKYE